MRYCISAQNIVTVISEENKKMYVIHTLSMQIDFKISKMIRRRLKMIYMVCIFRFLNSQKGINYKRNITPIRRTSPVPLFPKPGIMALKLWMPRNGCL